MKRYESGYDMTIIMKADVTEKQMMLAKKIYPNALVIKEMEVPKVRFNLNLSSDLINKKLSSKNDISSDLSQKIDYKTNLIYSSVYNESKIKNIVRVDFSSFAA